MGSIALPWFLVCVFSVTIIVLLFDYHAKGWITINQTFMEFGEWLLVKIFRKICITAKIDPRDMSYDVCHICVHFKQTVITYWNFPNLFGGLESVAYPWGWKRVTVLNLSKYINIYRNSTVIGVLLRVLVRRAKLKKQFASLIEIMTNYSSNAMFPKIYARYKFEVCRGS